MPSRRARSSGDARRDLAAIFSGTRKEWGLEQARRYRASLKATCARLAEYPEMGRLVSGLEGVRSFPAQRHVILYTVTVDGVFVLRFIHQREDRSYLDVP